MPPDADFVYEDLTLDGPAGSCTALLVTPGRRVEVGLPRLQQIREGNERSEVDDEIVRAVRERLEPPDVVLFRANRDDPEHSWGYEPGLSDEDVRALGYEMVRTQLALYRKLVVLGVFALVGIEMGDREYESFRAGAKAVGRDLERRLAELDGKAAQACRLELWLLDHLALWSPRSFGDVVSEELPEILRLLDRRRQQIQALGAGLEISGDR